MRTFDSSTVEVNNRPAEHRHEVAGSARRGKAAWGAQRWRTDPRYRASRDGENRAECSRIAEC